MMSGRSCLPHANEFNDYRQHKQCDAEVTKKQKGAEALRLLAERDDLLTRVPCERKADGNIVTAKPSRNGCDHERGKNEDAPSNGGAHMLANE